MNELKEQLDKTLDSIKSMAESDDKFKIYSYGALGMLRSLKERYNSGGDPEEILAVSFELIPILESVTKDLNVNKEI